MLYEGTEPIEERLFKLLEDNKYRIHHFGKSIMGEIIGWAMPERYPIRNNRVNKALRALGFDVSVS
ncbi:hypothetical protein N752_24475 [Desulforamulus aquiferis]|nr:hypothetical protein [Desulforamulus aquiferis]RYD02488.1 hypothetical protein N752_24475 [Desulforamulus aquiferis]